MVERRAHREDDPVGAGVDVRADAVDHLRRAIETREQLRDLAKDDSDFDPIRDEPAFKELIESSA